MNHLFDEICAVVLAAGMSTRMGAPKLALPWKGSTVIGAVLEVLRNAGLRRIRVVLGAHREAVERILGGQPAAIERVFNPNYANGEMMDSIRAGLAGLETEVKAALIVLGDQPQIEEAVVSKLIMRYRETGSPLIAPSYQKRRGHPWLVERSLWADLTGTEGGGTMRSFLNRHAERIDYVDVENTSILQDLDTPEDYRKATGQDALQKKKNN